MKAAIVSPPTSLATSKKLNLNEDMKGSSGKRLLFFIAGLGALIGALVMWERDSNTILLGLCAAIGLIVLAWVQFGEEFRKR